MAEPDIVERLRELLLENAGRELVTVPSADLARLGNEIERLRGGGWTRLADELPPQDGTPFELRFDGNRRRIIAQRVRISSRTVNIFAVNVHVDERWGVGSTEVKEEHLHSRAGWWRLLPGGEPPT